MTDLLNSYERDLDNEAQIHEALIAYQNYMSKRTSISPLRKLNESAVAIAIERYWKMPENDRRAVARTADDDAMTPFLNEFYTRHPNATTLVKLPWYKRLFRKSFIGSR